MVCKTIIAFILSAFLGNAGDNAALYYGRLEPQSQYITSSWRGNPYWEDTDFHIGEVLYDGVPYDSVMVRYNIVSNEVAVLTPERHIAVVPDQSKIGYFTIEGKRYEPLNDWFVCVEADGAYRLLHAKTKRQGTDVIEDRHVIHTIRTIEQHYLCDPTGKITKVSSLNDLCRACPEHAAELKALKKANKLKFGGKTRTQDLTQCVELLNTHYPTPDIKDLKRTNTVDDGLIRTRAHTHERLPDSIFASVSVPESLPAYRAYSSTNERNDEYVNDDGSTVTLGIVSLDPAQEARVLDDIEVRAVKRKSAALHTGMESFRPSLLRNVPTVMGVNDVMKLALMLPGVTSTGEAASGLNVRGGGADQNLTLYNGNTIFNPTHMFGLFSAFNSDMIAETELFKGGLPSQYGGRLSSVMNIKGRSASKDKFGGSASIGLVTSNAMLELPLVKNRASLLLGGRTTYSDWMLKKIPESSGYRNGKAGFWDASATFSTQLGHRGSLMVSGYYSQDRFSFTDLDKYGYSNLNVSGEYRTRFSDHTSGQLSAGYDHYDYRNDVLEDEFSAGRLTFSLNQYFLRASATHELKDRHSLKVGVQSQFYSVMPGQYVPVGDLSMVVGRKLDESRALENALFGEDNWQLSDRWSLVGGIRLNVFNSMRKNLATTYVNPDVRASATYKISDDHTLKLGLNTQHQYIHKVSNTVIMSPTDTWMLSNAKIKPQSGWQASVGYFWQSPSRDFEVSAEAYYKGMKNYLTYRSGAQLVMNPNLEDDVVGTKGRAYGLEIQLSKPSGKLNGWISYSYSRAMLRQTHGAVLINNGAWFPAEFDSPHIVKMVANYKFTRRYSTSVNVDYSTGRPYTAPVAQYDDHEQGIIVPLYSDRNQLRMPDYFRIDWSFNIEPSHHLTNLTHSWLTIGVYNVLGRKNAYSIFYKYDRTEIKGYKLSIFGAPIPYISYNIKF